jgi:hypothetical protein
VVLDSCTRSGPAGGFTARVEMQGGDVYPVSAWFIDRHVTPGEAGGFLGGFGGAARFLS